MDYLLLKTLHQSLVTLSIAGFAARGLGSLNGAAWVGRPLAKRLPHLVDSLLLLSALALLWMLQLNPLSSPWLLAKLLGLLLYIGLGVLALQARRPAWQRTLAFAAALATVGWMVSVAISKSPWGFFRLMLQ
ncbi:putative membrane protein SirB2 [Paucibacter oligotrophus]|uniref:Putative membrane protein SirB2 n=1 Tax=Roseateles oligotrophus TaxID=1769250 RepID=A0A840L4A1_9BURK|nr:SirB2 family protein [Roseateles oligotrophus]MBB4843030.1 putative membrane protein SirB2 [Roseateles oligotrophus]